MTETFALLHGTTAANAASILAGGFRRSDPRSAAAVVAAAFDLTPSDIWLNEGFSFPRGRSDLDRVHFTTNPWTAWHYSVPEAIQDALAVAHRILCPPHHKEGSREYRAREKLWLAAAVPEVVSSRVVLRVEVPWAVIGDNAFGRVLTREDFRELLADELPETLSLPLPALEGAFISYCELPRAAS